MFVWWVGLAMAQDDLQKAAEERMGLSFELEQVEGRLERSKRSAAPPRVSEPSPAPPATYDEAYDPYAQPAPVLLPPRRLPLEPNSTLRSVTVHRDRALVTRVRELTLPVGPHTVTFEGLPLGIPDEGLMASIEAGGARIVSVENVSGAGEVRDDARIEQVRTEAEALVDQLGDVRDRIESLLAERHYLRSALASEGATTAQTVVQVRAGLAFVSEAERRIAHDLREQEDDATELAEKLEPLLVKLDDPLATGQPVRIDVEVVEPGPVRVSLRYTVLGAGWTPSYSARLDPETDEIELEVYGVVAQSTSEDWTDAEIALSTADPNGRGNVPDLEPWTLGRSGGVGVYGALDLGTGATTGPPPPLAGGGVVDSRLDARVEGRGSVVFGIEGKRTIRGDGSPQRLPVGVQKLSSILTLATVPKLAPEVQRRATVRYDGALPLLPGPASSFVGRDYVGSGEIRAVVPGETLELAFGTDDRFRVTRQLVSRNQERINRKTARYTFRFRTTIANHGDETETVALTDQLPLSEDARIEVKVLDLSSGTTRPEDGTVAWSLAVPAHGEVHVELAFSVTVPDELSNVASDFEMMY